MKATTLRIVLALLVAGAFLLTFSSARDKIEQDLLVPLFGAKHAEALEDYQKKYLCLEIKSGNTKNIKPVFPLKHDLKLINPKNYWEVLRKI